MTTTKSEIYLYGSRVAGFGYIGVIHRGRDQQTLTDSWSGGVEGLRYPTVTAALWAADAALVEAGIRGGTELFLVAPGGEMVSWARVGCLPSFGSIAWVYPQEVAS